MILISKSNIISNINYNYIYSSYITLKIKGPGRKYISTHINYQEVYINGIKNNDTLTNNYYLNDTDNEIKLIFINEIKSCEDMFIDCNDIYEIDLSNFDSTLVTSINYMFGRCTSLVSLNLENIDASNVSSAIGTFAECHSLISLNLANFKNSNIANMGFVFYGLYSLSSLDVSYLNTSKVYYMEAMFYECLSLVSLNLANFNTKNVRNMGAMFAHCSSLKSINISSFDTSKVTDMYGLFFGCSSLVSLDLTNFNTSQVTNMYAMFAGCSLLKSLDLSSFNTSKVTNLTGLFESCESLTTLDLSFFDTSKVTIMNNLFFDCQSLHLLNISNFDTSQVSNMIYMFYNCISLTSLNLSHFNTSKVSDMEAMFWNCISLTSLVLSNFNTSKVTNIDFLFRNCGSLASIDLSSFNTINIQDSSAVFLNCESLTSLNLSNFDTSNMIYMNYMFAGCSKLTFLDLHSFNTTNVKSLYHMFDSCSSISSLDLSNFNTSNVNYIDGMFLNCNNLGYINFNKLKIKAENISINNFISGTALNLAICTYDRIFISQFDDNGCVIIDCSENINDKRKRIIAENNTCVDNCSMVYNTFEYNFKCYKNCPDGSIKYIYFDSDNNIQINCSNSDEGYYLDNDDLIYKSCYPSCKSCKGKGDEINHNCILCKEGYIPYDNNLNELNCILNCSNYIYYNNITNNYHCTNSLQCPKNTNKLIPNEYKCIDECKNDFNYKYEYLNICYSECPHNTINNSYYCESLHNNLDNKNELIINIQNIFNISVDKEMINNEIYVEMTFNESSAIFSSTDYLKKNDTSKIIMDLGVCENILKETYKISDNNTLYILIVIIKQAGMKIDKIEYEVFNIINKDNLTKLNLSLCKSKKAIISYPVSIDDDIDKFNSSSGYYNDVCYTTSSEFGTDLCLKDRRDIFIDKNMTLCEENCILIDYDFINKRAKCSCKIKISLPFIKDVKFDKERLKDNFKNINNIANLQFMKCFKNAFTKDIINNYGFYILDTIILSYAICLILFYSNFYYLLIERIKLLFSNINYSENNFKNTSINNKNIININNTDILDINKESKKIKKKNKNFEIINLKRYRGNKLNKNRNNNNNNQTKIEISSDYTKK